MQINKQIINKITQRLLVSAGICFYPNDKVEFADDDLAFYIVEEELTSINIDLNCAQYSLLMETLKTNCLKEIRLQNNNNSLELINDLTEEDIISYELYGETTNTLTNEKKELLNKYIIILKSIMALNLK
jgi:hypothetical protein